MSVPGFPASVPPPLPPGWTEHIGPGGQVYYHSVITKESTYVRPLPTFAALAQAQAAPPKKKEKPLVKTPIPGTDWIRVKTNQGNVFYTHKVKKESIWTVPGEIKDAVDALERQEEEDKQKSELEREQEAKRKAEEDEISRIRAEVEGAFKKKEAEAAKRKAEEDVPLDEVVVTKKARVDDEEEDEGGDESDESEEEEWQKEAAAQLAAEAEEEKRIRTEEEERAKKAEEAEKASFKESMVKLNMPDRVDLSIEEGKALFKTLLREKDVNPLHPWDTSLPLFISDPRYVLLPSVSARREAFDEYCRERARELRASRVKKEKEDPKEEFERLLMEEVKSTRTSWNDFRRTWKKDRRFYGWGRDEREREKRFRDFLKELGERKRAAAQKAEIDFFALLKESGVATAGAIWKDVKRGITTDPRYDAVGSSSLREELFNAFLKAQSSRESADPVASSSSDKPPVEDEAEKAKKRQERKEQAVKEREEKIKAERNRVDAEINKSRMGLNREEGELEFRTLLTDAIREPQATWDSSVSQLETDPRFTRSVLPLNHQLHLFHTHVGQLRARHLDNLHALFQAGAPSLATPFSALPLESILNSLPATKLGFDAHMLEQEFDKWQRERTTEARKAFDEMLHENAFVEFWGRLGKIGGEGADGGVKRDEDFDEDEGEAGGGNVDMKTLAKNVDITDIQKVLKSEKRYLMFDHVPEQRERWLRVSRRNSSSALNPPALTASPLTAVMRFLTPLLAGLTLFSYASAQELGADAPAEKHGYQSDVARLRNIVINRCVDRNHRDVFLRELISNANDALEKLRLTSLTHRELWDGSSPLNITIKAVKDAEGGGGRLIITGPDNGIGMTPEELTNNLGTLAKSGTTEFLSKAENAQDTTGNGNLIGAFGLGFYSSFLVADKVYVASVSAQSAASSNPVQFVFSSSSDANDFTTYPDPRGRTLQRGTELTLVLKPDALEYLENRNIIELINKHSAFSSSFPVYLYEKRDEEVPVEDEPTTDTPPKVREDGADEDEAVIEEVEDKVDDEPKQPQTKTVTVEEWQHINASPPLWTRDPKNVTSVEYGLFYQATFRDFKAQPLAWNHFSGDLGSGVSFKAIIFVPGALDDSWWQAPLQNAARDIRLMVKRVFITSDLGEDYLPKWASWVKAVIDADDLPLNVSRETLQNTSFLRQIKQIILKRIIQTFTKIAEDDQQKFEELHKIYGNVLKLGAVEDTKNRDKLSTLVRFSTNHRNMTSLDAYLENKKEGQKQIFYVSDMGKTVQGLLKSVFVEKLHARGYEVFLLTDPLDEVLFQNLRKWKGVPFQDVAKAGLKFGDEDLDPEEEKEKAQEIKDKFQPLLTWLKNQAGEVVRDVIISDRLVSSPCAIVADAMGYTANVQRMMSASNARKADGNSAMHEYAKRQKVLELNPKSPLIEGLLRRVENLPPPEEERDFEAEDELKEVTSILIDGALVRSGFEVPDSDEFLIRVDRVLRRSLGVSETAPTDTTVKPAPPVDPEILDEAAYEPKPDIPVIPEEEDDGKARVIIPDDLKGKLDIQMEEIGDDEYPVVHHDEL
ncbi:HSP90-domain-containing protein [Artomyces pyxidatus]|uniref:HSP90-domain-containing protein n=1 Tax=Artomyces pyxidatus TaxID=48021 RepID=A0ACB8TJV7_9AGAM|nr:HSP90-domain-containing protein [Artomyces pyxidatus]